MSPPPIVGTTFYRYRHVRRSSGRIERDWVKHTVRAVVDWRIANGENEYQLVVRRIRRPHGWVYELVSEAIFSLLVGDGAIVVSNNVPKLVPLARRPR